jgi:transcription termination factor Rho
MSMMELNGMAKELRRGKFRHDAQARGHFHILQKNAERAGVLFSEGVLEILPEGFGFCGRRVSITSPCPRTFTFRRRKSAGSICRRAT